MSEWILIASGVALLILIFVLIWKYYYVPPKKIWGQQIERLRAQNDQLFAGALSERLRRFDAETQVENLRLGIANANQRNDRLFAELMNERAMRYAAEGKLKEDLS